MAIIHDPIAEEFFDDNCERDDVWGEKSMHTVEIFDENGCQLIYWEFETAEEAYEKFLEFSKVFENYLFKGRRVTLCRFKDGYIMSLRKFEGIA